LRQELMAPCQRDLAELVGVIGGRTDLTTMHERYMHECNVHNDWTACENATTVLKSLKDREILDHTIREFTSCIEAQRTRATI